MPIIDDLSGAALVHHGLFKLPWLYIGIVWMRLYRCSNKRHLAFVTEVPGNPRPGRGATFFRALLAREFSIDSAFFDVVVIWPKRQTDGRITAATWELLSTDSAYNLRELDRATIEEALALLPPLPDHAQLFAQVLARGGKSRDIKGDTWQVIDVQSLPPPHLPFKCRHKDRFQTIVGSEKTIEAHLIAGRRFLESLTDADRQQCPYHRADWAAVANASAQIVASAPNGDAADFIARAKRQRLPARDRRSLVDLFDEPIVLRDGRTKYVNGQHRGCAIRFSGAARVGVVIEGSPSGQVQADWIYLGEG